MFGICVVRIMLGLPSTENSKYLQVDASPKHNHYISTMDFVCVYVPVLRGQKIISVRILNHFAVMDHT